MNSLPSHMTLVYVVKSFKSKRHKVSDTDSYFAYPHHAIWGLTDGVDTIMRVEMVKVLIGSQQYLSAHNNSKIADEEEKERVLKKLEKKCVVCDEDGKRYGVGFNCKTCQNMMCHVCCCEYSLANEGKFRCESDDSDTMYMPCPICRTENPFRF